MLKRIIEDIKKKENYSFEKIIEDNNMSDDDFFELLKFIYSEKISEIRTSTENNDFIVLEDENYYVEEKETIKESLEKMFNLIDDIKNDMDISKLMNKYNKK